VTLNYLPDILETAEPQRLATGFKFTEGPLWHPDGYWYFVDLRPNRLHRIRAGEKPELVRETEGGNGTTFDLQGNLIHCEGEGRKVTRLYSDGRVEIVADRFMGGRFSRPNDVVCRSDGTLFFTDPDKRVPYREREIPPPEGVDNLWDGASVYSVAPDGATVYSCAQDAAEFYVIDTRSHAVTRTVPIDGANPDKKQMRRVRVSPDNTYVTGARITVDGGVTVGF